MIYLYNIFHAKIAAQSASHAKQDTKTESMKTSIKADKKIILLIMKE